MFFFKLNVIPINISTIKMNLSKEKEPAPMLDISKEIPCVGMSYCVVLPQIV